MTAPTSPVQTAAHPQASAERPIRLQAVGRTLEALIARGASQHQIRAFLLGFGSGALAALQARTDHGTPLEPLIAQCALDGLQDALHELTPDEGRNRWTDDAICKSLHAAAQHHGTACASGLATQAEALVMPVREMLALLVTREAPAGYAGPRLALTKLSGRQLRRVETALRALGIDEAIADVAAELATRGTGWMETQAPELVGPSIPATQATAVTPLKSRQVAVRQHAN